MPQDPYSPYQPSRLGQPVTGRGSVVGRDVTAPPPVAARIPPPRATGSAPQPEAPALTPEQDLMRRRSELLGRLGGEPDDPEQLRRQIEVIDTQLREIRFANEQALLRKQAETAGQLTPAQIQRIGVAQGIAGRAIGEESQLRQGQLESSLAGMGLGESVVGETARARERELTARMTQQTVSQILSGELQRTFVAEQAAIDRLFQSGQAELGFQRQWQLAERQLAASIQIAEMQADSSLWGDIFGAVGQVAAAAIPVL